MTKYISTCGLDVIHEERILLLERVGNWNTHVKSRILQISDLSEHISLADSP